MTEPSELDTTQLVRVAPGVLVVGRPLPWTVYDRSGQVLLKQGYVIQNDSQLERLFRRGLFQPAYQEVDTHTEWEEQRSLRNPFSDYPALLNTISSTAQCIHDKAPDARERLLGLARFVSHMCREAPDPMLALPHLYCAEPSGRELLLFYAILCHFIGEQLWLDEKRVTVLVAAGLTGNLALQPYVDKLNHSSHRLSDKQRAILRKHPTLGARALREAGIKNRLLLTIIEQHHEEADGSGYPHGLTAGNILPEARALAVAERYMAMIGRRPYRDRLGIAKARELLAELAVGQQETEVHRALLDALTPYPPGALVKLKSGELGVVTHRTTPEQEGLIRAVVSASGHQYVDGQDRAINPRDDNIRAIEEPETLPSMDFSALWGFETED